MKFFIPATLSFVFLLSCTAGEDVASSSTPLSASIVLEGEALSQEPAPVDASAVSPSSEIGHVKSAKLGPKASSLDALKYLSKWHRLTGVARVEMLGESPGSPWARVLVDFVEGLNSPAAYRANLRLEIPSAFGDDFSSFADVYANQGLGALCDLLIANEDRGPSWLVWSEVAVRESLVNEDYVSSGALFGELLEAMINDGYDRLRVLELSDLSQKFFRSVSEFVKTEPYTAQSGDSLWKICRDWKKKDRYFSSRWLMAVNGKSSETVRLGEVLMIPTGQLRVVIWRAFCLLALYVDGVPIRLLPASMGRDGFDTPAGDFTIGQCIEEPVWWGVSPALPYEKPESKTGVRPENPLGERWLGFVEKTDYGIHGTNAPETIGTFESDGCVRLLNEEVIDLFGIIAPGVKVRINP